MTVLISVVILGFLILFHELGHFIAARIAGVGVLEFSIGFGPGIVSMIAPSGTRYSLRAFPLGAFVRLEGETPGDETRPAASLELASTVNRSALEWPSWLRDPS